MMIMIMMKYFVGIFQFSDHEKTLDSECKELVQGLEGRSTSGAGFACLM
jgi:hypothetical protein